MNGFSLSPDDCMRWIYDYNHPEYNSDRARWLRERRAAALRNAPKWMIAEAAFNDHMKMAENK